MLNKSQNCVPIESGRNRADYRSFRRPGIVSAAFALALFGFASKADVIYSNFDAANSNRSSPALPIATGGGGWTVAQSFTPTQDYILGSVAIALSVPSSDSSGSFTVAVIADSGSGSPGTVIEQFTVTSVPLSGTPVLPVVLNSVLNPTLKTNTTYWLAVAPGSSTVFGYWQSNLTGDVAGAIGTPQTLVSTAGLAGPWDDGSAWSGQPRGAFSISGNPASGPSAPAITSLVPNTISAGSPAFTLTVNGTRFLTGATLLWNGTALTTTLVSDSQLTASVPASLVVSPGVTSVTVKNASGLVSNAVNFTITALPQFSISGLSPSSVMAGAAAFTLTITGTNFSSGATVHFGTGILTPSSVSSSQIQVTVPAALVATAGTQSVTVVQSSSTSNAVTFTVNASTVTITSLNPSSVVAGVSGLAIFIAGTGFTSDATVIFGGTTLTPTTVTPAQILVTIPAALVASIGTPSITVTEPTGASNSVTFLIGELPGQPLAIATSPLLPVGKVGVAYSASLLGTGGAPPYTWTLTSATLPAGLSLASSGAITGTPTSSLYALFTAKVTDNAAASVSGSFVLNITAATPPPSISTGTTLPPGTVGAAYSLALTATGGTPPYVWTVPPGDLPDGLTLSSGGLISGKPTTAGTNNFTVQLTDATQAITSKAFTLAINQPVVTQTSVLSHFTAGGGWKSSLYLVNTTASAITVDVKLWSDSGAPLTLDLTTTIGGVTHSLSAAEVSETLPSDATLLIESDALGAAVASSGWVQVSTPGTVNGYCVFHYTSGSGVESSGTVPLESTFSPSFILPYDGVGGLATGVALANLAATQAAVVNVTIMNENGAQIGAGAVDLPAGGHTAFLLADKFPATISNRGIIQFSSVAATNITGLGLRLDPTGGFTSIPKIQ